MAAGCVVPAVVAKSLPSAKAAIGAAHCRVGTITLAFSATIPKGVVVSQLPRAKRHARTGTRISIVVSRGPEPPAPTLERRLVDVGGYKLYLECIGTGTPTVILESGANGTDWSFVEPSVASFTRVCAYDRAGTGSSEPRPAGIAATASRVAAELHTLVAAAGIEGPDVLVGHSLGGFYSHLYAKLYPNDVAGLVLVDGAPEQWMQANLPALAPFALGVDLADGIQQLLGWSSGSLPLVVLAQTQGQLPPPLPYAGWLDGQKSIAQRSADAWLVRVNSGHDIPARFGGRPQAVIEAVRAVVTAARAKAPLPACAGSALADYGTCLATTR